MCLCSSHSCFGIVLPLIFICSITCNNRCTWENFPEVRIVILFELRSQLGFQELLSVGLHPSSSAWPLCFSAQCRGVLHTLGLSLTLVLTQPLLCAEVMHLLLHMCFKLLQNLIHQWATSLKIEQEVVFSMPYLRRLRCEVEFAVCVHPYMLSICFT